MKSRKYAVGLVLFVTLSLLLSACAPTTAPAPQAAPPAQPTQAQPAQAAQPQPTQAQAAAPAQQVTLDFWDNQQSESGLSEFQQAAVKEFEAANPNIKINVTTVPYPEYRDKLLTTVQGGNAPCISTVDQIWNSEFATAKAIVPLDDYVAKSATVKKDNFFPGAWDSATYQGKVWGIPFNVDVWQFSFYNADLLKAANVDPNSLVTWQGLMDGSAKLTDKAKGQYGVGLIGHKGEDTVVIQDSFIYSNGGSVLNEDGTCALDKPESVEALKYLVDLSKYAPEGIANAATDDMRKLFLNGSLAVEWWPALEQPSLQKSNLNWDFVVGTAPEGKKPVGTYGGWNLVVYDKCQYKDEAWKFIEFVTAKENNGKFVDLIPANVQAADAFLKEKRKGPDKILTHLNNARPRPLSPVYNQVSAVQQDLAQAIFTGTKVEDAVKTACDKINALVKK